MKTGPRATPAAERFWPKVAVANPDDCWEWKASKATNGYGKFWDGTRLTEAHRMAYRLVKGEIPDGLFILHSCDNPACVNPAHLRTGTQVDNVRDMHSKGRYNSYFAKRSACVHGHEYTPETTYWYGKTRRCKVCIYRRSGTQYTPQPITQGVAK